VPIRLLIADDDPTIRLLLRRLFEHHAGWEVCDECANGSEALEKALKLAPDIVILDLAMPGMNGLQSAQQILRIKPSGTHSSSQCTAGIKTARGGSPQHRFPRSGHQRQWPGSSRRSGDPAQRRKFLRAHASGGHFPPE
jgi:CheY-like chemotaxis protein